MGRAFEYRKDRKMKRWSQMAKVFTKIGREIALAVKEGGPEPSANPRLRLAIQNGKLANMPKVNVENAIKRAISKDAEDLIEMVYEGFGPHGIAFLIETLTDNPTRTVAAMRLYLNRSGGALGTSGSVAFMFDRVGEFVFELGNRNIDDIELDLIDGGAEEIEMGEDNTVYVYTAFDGFGAMQGKLEELGIEVKEATLQRFPQVTKEITDAQKEEIEKLIDKFEDDDDVQKVFHNMS